MMIQAPNRQGPLFRMAESRQQQAGEDADDGDHDQQFHQGESMIIGLVFHANAPAGGRPLLQIIRSQTPNTSIGGCGFSNPD